MSDSSKILDQQPQYLAGQLIIAMPAMRDPRFEKTVIYMCAHNDDGAMGLVVNRAMESLTFPDMLEQLGIDPVGAGDDMRRGQDMAFLRDEHAATQTFPDLPALVGQRRFGSQDRHDRGKHLFVEARRSGLIVREVGRRLPHRWRLMLLGP